MSEQLQSYSFLSFALWDYKHEDLSSVFECLDAVYIYIDSEYYQFDYSSKKRIGYSFYKARIILSTTSFCSKYVL